MSDKKKGAKRRAYIDNAIAAAEGTLKKRDYKEKQDEVKGVSYDDNPHKEGSTLAKLWERKRKAGKLEAQK